MRRVLLLSGLILVGSCTSTDDFTPTTPSPGNTIPTIGGTYTSPTMWRFELTSAAEQSVFSCAGSLTIASQIGANFSGTFLILDPACGAAFGGLVTNGVLIPGDGTVTFDLNFTQGGANFITTAFGCTYVSGATGLTGTLIGTQLDAEARTELDCVPDGRVTQLVRLGGSR